MNYSAAATTPWLRNRPFDLTFIVGVAAVALLSGAAVTWDNDLFFPILAADLWLLGYHHVISTYTRLVFDKESFAEHHKLITLGFPAVALAVVLLVLFAGLWVVPTIYLYWQWWHYTRQSEGIAKAYAGKAGNISLATDWLTRAAFYGVPIAGLLIISYRSPANFLFMPLRTLPVPLILMQLAVVVAVALLAWWLFRQFLAWRNGELAAPYFAYVCSHFVIYVVAYAGIENWDHGWLVINVWHNAQYILFVWLYNNKRFGGAVNEQHRFLSTLSQNGRLLLYLATCLCLSTLVYFLIATYVEGTLSTTFAVTATMAGLMVYQTINFHHYVVDSVIWKLRKKKLRDNLGIR